METLEQVVEQMRYYQSIGIQTVSLSGLPTDPARLARLLAQRIDADTATVDEPAPAATVPRPLEHRPNPTLAEPAPMPAFVAAPTTEQQTTEPSSEPESSSPSAPRRSPRRSLFDFEAPPAEQKPPDGLAALPSNDTLEGIRQDLGDCRRCKLSKTRQSIVFGCGSPQAELMLIGEGPGADEDEQGLPFVGRAGQLLTKILEAINLTRDQVYITNVVKCRPPQNRKPEPDEVDPCEPYLLRQIKTVNPKLICALGGTAAQALLKSKEGITSMRGRVFNFHGYKMIPTFHPAYLLRNPADKRLVWEDMQKIRDYLLGKITL